MDQFTTETVDALEKKQDITVKGNLVLRKALNNFNVILLK